MICKYREKNKTKKHSLFRNDFLSLFIFMAYLTNTLWNILLNVEYKFFPKFLFRIRLK